MATIDQALSGMKVLDLTHYIAGPFCTKLLADYGADVIKIERPGNGDGARHVGPFPGDIPDPEKSGLFLYLNTNKRSITLNLKTQTGVDILKKLVKQADILVESFSPGVMSGLGLDYQTLKQIKPQLVMTSLSNFGQSGPYRDWKATEITLYALSGQMYKLGDSAREPLKHALNVTQYYAGKIASLVTLAAALRAGDKSLGEYIDTSIFEILVCDIDNAIVDYDYGGEKGTRRISKDRPFPPFGGFPVKDGYVAFQGAERWMPRLFAMIGKPELKDDPRFSKPANRKKHEAELNELLFSWLLDHTKQEVFEAGGNARHPVAPVFNTEDLVKDSHYAERGTFIEIEHPVAGTLTYPGAPFKMSEAGFAIRRPAPLLGEHNEEIYGGLGYSAKDLAILRSCGVI